MKHFIISLFFLLPFAIQCNEKQPLLQLKKTTIDNLKSVLNSSVNYNFCINCLLTIGFIGGGMYAHEKHQQIVPWFLAAFCYLSIAISQVVFLKKMEDLTSQSLPT